MAVRKVSVVDVLLPWCPSLSIVVESFVGWRFSSICSPDSSRSPVFSRETCLWVIFVTID